MNSANKAKWREIYALRLMVELGEWSNAAGHTPIEVIEAILDLCAVLHCRADELVREASKQVLERLPERYRTLPEDGRATYKRVVLEEWHDLLKGKGV